MGHATTLLFGLPGVAVDTVQIDGEGTRIVHVVTDDPTAAACPSCGVFSTSIKQYRTTRPKDLPYGEVAAAWWCAQRLRDVYRAAGRQRAATVLEPVLSSQPHTPSPGLSPVP